MAGYWNSPDFIYIGNKQVTRGWQAMLDRYRQAFQAPNQSQMGRWSCWRRKSPRSINKPRWSGHVPRQHFRRQAPWRSVHSGHAQVPQGWLTVYDRTSSEPLAN